MSDHTQVTDGQVVAIDGKTLRRSFDAASSKSAIHLVSAWATANLSSLRRTALSLLKNNHTLQLGIKNKRLAAWNNDYLAEVLFGKSLLVQSP